MLKFQALFLSLSLFCIQPLFGYVLEGESWTLDRTVVMQLSFVRSQPLKDGFASFNASAKDALDTWNSHLDHLDFASVLASPVTPVGDDDEMSAFFSYTVFGENFGDSALAVTLLSFRDNVLEETDTIFNSTYMWDSYSGPLNGIGPDFHRVALHEFGHTLGLDHPDEAGQTKRAIMNSQVSDIDTLQPDDINGVQALYGAGPAYQFSVNAPVLANIATRGLIGTGDDVLIGGFIVQGTEPATVILRGIGFSLAAQGITGALADPMMTVYDSNQREIASNDDWCFNSADAETIASYHLDPPNSRESALYLVLAPGAYTVVVESFSNAGTPPTTGIGLFELYDLHTTGGRAGNIATRGQVLSGDNVLIGGLIIGGNESKPVIVRAIGPSLGEAVVANVLANPSLELHDANGDLLQSNDDWAEGPDAQTIEDDGLAPTRAKESALFATLDPGSYTAIVSGSGGGTGIGLVEVYDISAVPGL